MLPPITAAIFTDFPSNCFPDFKHYKSFCLLQQQSICEFFDKASISLYILQFVFQLVMSHEHYMNKQKDNICMTKEQGTITDPRHDKPLT